MTIGTRRRLCENARMAVSRVSFTPTQKYKKELADIHQATQKVTKKSVAGFEYRAEHYFLCPKRVR